MIKKNRYFIVLIAFFLLFLPSCFFGYVYYKVTRDAATHIRRGAIDRIIASESPVYYDDGRMPIGVFFEKTHRKHIYYEDIPKIFIKALIAAEDSNFFDHMGFDLKAILRALVANVKTGRVVQGGSTITQQTAKSIFRREKRSYKAKLRELIQAFLLERKYTKEEIIEMYVNQFFVTGYGKGLGIAAQYYFGKEVRNLDLVEAAFIAGSVKGPNRYNPFIKKSDTEAEKARQLAKIRKDYVVSNMLKANFITKTQYMKAKERDIPFREGKITYRLNVILDYVREQLESDYFKSMLKEQGVDNAATSGISIFTSINKEIQDAALISLRKHLPLMDVKLSGYSVGLMTETYQKLLEKGLKKSGGILPFLSRITQIDANRQNGHMVVAWDHGGGLIDYEGIKPMGEAWLKWKLGEWATFDRKHVQMFLKNLHVGDLVPVESVASPNGKGDVKLMLSLIPELEGGIVVVQKGMIRAMVGGFLNRFFNRAVDAKRQLGSIFKPIVYTAALQLKWNSLDPLQNVRQLFRFENTSYLPRPDHSPRSQWVSMAWAGVKSENLATVWLLYHLTDHLNMSEFRKVTDLVGLGREKRESYVLYKKRIRDRHGVVVNKEALMEAAFEKSKKEVESDIIFGGYEEILNNTGRLHFNIDSKELDLQGPEEQQILRFDFRRLHELNLKMKARFQKTRRVLEQYARNRIPETKKRLSESLRHFFRVQGMGDQDKVIYTEDALSPSASTLIKLTPEWALKKFASFSTQKVWIDGLITSEIMDLLQENIKKNYRRLVTYRRYDPEVLSGVRDFRTLVNLYYMVYLSKKMGISTKLDPVLSFPLGPNSISIMEAALAYQTIMTGRVYPLGPEGDLTDVPIITKIVDREGEILWEYEPKPKKVLSDRVSGLMTEILRKVVETGTGRKARDAIQVSGIPVPSFGKTGTANRFTNSSFVGFIPGCNKKTGRLDINEGFVIASYVGYDDNRPMKGRHLAIYGASGALPLWVDTADAIVNTHDYKENLLPANLAFEPLATNLSLGHKDLRSVPVSPVSGLPVNLSDEAADSSHFPWIFSDVEDRGDTWEFKRHFEPLHSALSLSGKDER